nr:hypothetical protein BaRGS_000144 [Batillaria attramentaria]
MPVAQDCAPSGFEEAALEQEQLEQESREAVEQFSDADQGYAGLAGVGDSTGSFEIGTFSVDDVGGASAGGGDGLRGRKITRQLSGEGDGNGEEWADAASEEKPGGTVDDEIGK